MKPCRITSIVFDFFIGRIHLLIYLYVERVYAHLKAISSLSHRLKQIQPITSLITSPSDDTDVGLIAKESRSHNLASEGPMPLNFCAFGPPPTLWCCRLFGCPMCQMSRVSGALTQWAMAPQNIFPMLFLLCLCLVEIFLCLRTGKYI